MIGVTKGFGPDAVRAALAAGLRDIGENYARELVEKAAALGAEGRGVVWHFLGAVQRNKVAELAPVVGWWESVARESEGARIARFAPGAPVLVQVDTTGLSGRNGCPTQAVAELVGRLARPGAGRPRAHDGGAAGTGRRPRRSPRWAGWPTSWGSRSAPWV